MRCGIVIDVTLDGAARCPKRGVVLASHVVRAGRLREIDQCVVCLDHALSVGPVVVDVPTAEDIMATNGVWQRVGR